MSKNIESEQVAQPRSQKNKKQKGNNKARKVAFDKNLKEIYDWRANYIKDNDGQTPNLRDVIDTAKADKYLNDILSFNPGNRNQQRYLLEKIGQKVVDEKIYDMGYNPQSFNNQSVAGRQNRYRLERAIIADDLEDGDYYGYNPAEYKKKYGKRAFRQVRRQGRQKRGGGLMGFVNNIADAAETLVPLASTALNSNLDHPYIQIAGKTVKNPETQSSYDLDAIDLDYVSACLCPEDYMARQQQDEVLNTALSHGKAVYNIQTSPTGNCGVYLFPNQPIISDDTQLMAGSFMTMLNDASFNPTTGIQVPPPNYTAGPLNGVASAILQYKCTGFSVTFLPTESSLNNQGEFYETYYTKPPNSSSDDSNFIVLPQAVLSNAYYYQFSNMKTLRDKRMIKVPTPGDSFQYNKQANSTIAPPFQNFYYLLFIGCQGSTTIGQIEVAYTYEFDPQIASMPICPVDQANPGAMTPQLLSNLFKEHKLLQSLDRDLIRKVISKVRSVMPKTHDAAMQAFREAVSLVD